MPEGLHIVYLENTQSRTKHRANSYQQVKGLPAKISIFLCSISNDEGGRLIYMPDKIHGQTIHKFLDDPLSKIITVLLDTKSQSQERAQLCFRNDLWIMIFFILDDFLPEKDTWSDESQVSGRSVIEDDDGFAGYKVPKQGKSTTLLQVVHWRWWQTADGGESQPGVIAS